MKMWDSSLRVRGPAAWLVVGLALTWRALVDGARCARVGLEVLARGLATLRRAWSRDVTRGGWRVDLDANLTRELRAQLDELRRRERALRVETTRTWYRDLHVVDGDVDALLRDAECLRADQRRLADDVLRWATAPDRITFRGV